MAEDSQRRVEIELVAVPNAGLVEAERVGRGVVCVGDDPGDPRRSWSVVAGPVVLGHVGLTAISWSQRSAVVSLALPALADLTTAAETLCEQPELSGLEVVERAMTLMLGLAFDTFNLHRTEMRVATNSPFAVVIETLGFEQEGALRRHHFDRGSYVDVVVYSKLASDRVAD